MCFLNHSIYSRVCFPNRLIVVCDKERRYTLSLLCLDQELGCWILTSQGQALTMTCGQDAHLTPSGKKLPHCGKLMQLTWNLIYDSEVKQQWRMQWESVCSPSRLNVQASAVIWKCAQFLYAERIEYCWLTSMPHSTKLGLYKIK